VMASKAYRLTVAGRLNDPQFQQARVLARFLASENSQVATSSIALMESEWEVYAKEKGRVRVCVACWWIPLSARVCVCPVSSAGPLTYEPLTMLRCGACVFALVWVCVPPSPQVLGGDAFNHRVSPMVFVNDTQYIGRTPELIAWMKTMFGVDGKANMVLYTRMANKAYRAYIDGHKHPHCYFDVSIGRLPPVVLACLLACMHA